MIPTGEYKGYDTVYNKIVFTDGNFENPSIIKVLEVDKNFEKENKFIEWLFEEYENGLSTSEKLFRVIENYSEQQGEVFCREFRVEDFGTLQELKEQRRTFIEDNKNNRREQDGARNSRKVKFSLKDSDGNELYNSSEIRYSFKGKKTASYINKRLDTPTLNFIRNELRKIYGSIDSAIADGIAIEKENSIFVVDSGIEDGKIDFGVRHQFKIDDANLRLMNLEEINDRAISKGYVDNEISKRIRHSSNNGSRGSVERKLSEELSDNTRKSENNESRISGKDAADGSRRLKFSLKDSDGNTLSPEQQEYFKNSEVVDKDGNLLVVYHQTSADFTVFDTTKKGAGHSDYEMPNGIFLKPTSENIGLKGDKQMRLYAKIENPLVFYNREHAQRYWKQNIDGYDAVVKKLAENDKKYNELFEDAFSEKRIARRRGVEFSDLTREQQASIIEESSRKCDEILKEWRAENSKIEIKAKALINSYLKKSGFDGIHLFEDKGSFGRKIETWIALSSNQVKNANNENPTTSPDIRFSLKSAFDKLGKYSEAETVSIEKNANFTIAKSYADIKNFIDNVKNFNNDKSLFLGKISNYYAEKIFDGTGIEVWNKSIVLNSSNLKHIFKSHGNVEKESLSGQIAISKDNIEDVIETLLSPDSVERSDSNGQIGILFKKNIGGKITAITILSE